MESRVISVITDYDTLTGSDLIFLRVGTAHWVASLVCLLAGRMALAGDESLIGSGGFQVGDYREFAPDTRALFEKLDWNDMSNELARQAASALGAISTRVWDVDDMPLMTTMGPRRAGTREPTFGDPDAWDDWMAIIKPTLVNWLEENGLR